MNGRVDTDKASAWINDLNPAAILPLPYGGGLTKNTNLIYLKHKPLYKIHNSWYNIAERIQYIVYLLLGPVVGSHTITPIKDKSLFQPGPGFLPPNTKSG